MYEYHPRSFMCLGFLSESSTIFTSKLTGKFCFKQKPVGTLGASFRISLTSWPSSEPQAAPQQFIHRTPKYISLWKKPQVTYHSGFNFAA